MINDIPTSEGPLETWLVDSSGNIAVSGAGVALLKVQIMPVYNANHEEFSSPNESRTKG